jgi:hypothetical protein
MIKGSEYDELVWILSQNDLELEWSAPHQAASDNERLSTAPEKIFFRWKREGRIIWSIELSREDLNDVINKLQDAGLIVPDAFREAVS